MPLLLLAACCARGQVDHPDTTGVVPEDLADLVEAMEIGGAPLSEDELRRLEGDLRAAADREAAGSPGWSPPGQGSLSWRMQMEPAPASPATATARWKGAGLDLKVRRGQSGGVAESPLAAFGGDVGHWRIHAGNLALHHGFGLLAGAPGRSGSPGTGRSLGPSPAAIRQWCRSGDGALAEGVGVSFSAGSLVAAAVSGTPTTEPGMGRLQAVRLGLRHVRGGVSFLGLSHPLENGLSLASEWGGAGWNAAWESSLTLRDGGGSAQGAVVSLALEPNRATHLEGGWASRRGGEPGLLGVRPAMLATWDGSGWACRLRWKGGGLDLELVIAGAKGRDEDPADGITCRSIREAAAACPLPGGWSAEVRWRRQVRTSWEWSERFPWTPAFPVAPEVRTLTSIRLRREGPAPGHLSLDWRNLAVDEGGGSAGRHLLSAGWSGAETRLGRARLGWSLAWGDQVDLVGVLSPLPGYALPRHWGRWSGEIMAGLEREAGIFGIQAAAARRFPAPGEPAATITEVWLQARIRW
ncbi:MAG: hypothetical protein ABIK96_15615 [bacterium]